MTSGVLGALAEGGPHAALPGTRTPCYTFAKSTTPGSTAPASREIHLAGGGLWGVQAFVDTLPGVLWTEVGRANGTTASLDGP